MSTTANKRCLTFENIFTEIVYKMLSFDLSNTVIDFYKMLFLTPQIFYKS